jgi:hypothetical protein
MALFDFYIMVDWSGAARRRGGVLTVFGLLTDHRS